MQLSYTFGFLIVDHSTTTAAPSYSIPLLTSEAEVVMKLACQVISISSFSLTTV